jgi:hypothetical protein
MGKSIRNQGMEWGYYTYYTQPSKDGHDIPLFGFFANFIFGGKCYVCIILHLQNPPAVVAKRLASISCKR